jgi:hypothetical protein
MSEVLEQQREETVPAEAPSALPSDAPIGTTPVSDDFQSLLDEFDAVTGKQAEEVPEPESNTGTVPNLDQQLQELLGPQHDPADRQRITDLEGELNSVRAAELERQARADFEGFSKKLQAELGPNVDEQFARTNLLAMAAENPALEHAWRYRNLTDAERKAADAEFQQLEVLYHRVQNAPNDPRKAQAIAALEQRGQQLGLMMNAHKILNNVWRDVQKRAAKVPPPIDTDATELRAEIAFQMKQGQGPAVIPGEKPNFGIMDDRTFKDYTKRHYGF